MSLASALAIADPAARATALVAVIDAAAARNDADTLKRAIDAAVDDATPTPSTRQILKHVAHAADTVLNDFDAIEGTVNYALEKLRPRLAPSQLEDVDFALRNALTAVYVGAQDWLRAAGLLSAARIDAPCFTDVDRLAFLVRCASNYISGEDDVSAERFIRRAGDLVHRLPPAEVDPLVIMKYRAAYTQMLDQKRRFLDAALRYMELMRQAGGVHGVGAAELRDMLEKAATCAILAPAGPQRQRVMATLMREEGIASVNPVVGGMLERMFTERFIMPGDLAAFVSTLATHQRATGADGLSLVQRAVLEHNVLAASKVYKNVAFEALATVLGVDAGRAEKIAAKMVNEGRLVATIDQVEGMLDFAPAARGSSGGGAKAPVPAMKNMAGGGAGGGAAAGGSGAEAGSAARAAAAAAAASSSGTAALAAWDASIKEVCMAVNDAVAAVGKAHPFLMEEGAS